MTRMVVKDNKLVQASYALGVAEQRMMLLAIVGARETGLGIDATTLLTVRAEDYASHFGVTRQAAYMALQDAVETLFNRRATVDVYDSRRNRMRPMTVRWVTAMDYNENEASVTMRFGHEVVPLITRLEEQFTSYELQQIAGLDSSYAIRLYELLMMWKVTGRTPTLELDQFRTQLGVDSDAYPRMYDFKKYVLVRGRDQALQCAYIQLNPPAFRYWLICDVDRAGAAFAAQDAGLPDPSWVAITRENRHAHLMWALETPVLLAENGSKTAMRYLRVLEACYSDLVGADVG